MSVLTKIFVVLVTLLSVALVAAMVPFVANTEDWRGKYNQERSAKLLAARLASNKQEALDSERSAKLDEIQGKSREIQQLKANIEDLVDLQSRSRAVIKKQEFDIASLEANESQSRASLKVQIETNSAMGKELTERRDRTREQSKQLLQLDRRVSELDNDNEALTRHLRFYSEQIVAMEQATRRLEDVLARIPEPVIEKYTGIKDRGNVIEARHDINGTVTDVRRVRDDTFVEVDVGRTSGVLPGMRFFVKRGELYVGTLVITNVEQRNAAGRMKLMADEVQIERGDEVTAGPALSAAQP